MFRCDGSVIDLSDVDAAVELSPQAVQQGGFVFESLFVCVQVVLQIGGQPILIGAFLFGLTDPFDGQKLHGHAKRLRQLIHRFSRAFFQPCLATAYIIERSVGNSCIYGQSVFGHVSLFQQILNRHSTHTLSAPIISVCRNNVKQAMRDLTKDLHLLRRPCHAAGQVDRRGGGVDNAHHVDSYRRVKSELLGNPRDFVSCQHDAKPQEHIAWEGEQSQE